MQAKFIVPPPECKLKHRRKTWGWGEAAGPQLLVN
jgi:hypothetical protein